MWGGRARDPFAEHQRRAQDEEHEWLPATALCKQLVLETETEAPSTAHLQRWVNVIWELRAILEVHSLPRQRPNNLTWWSPILTSNHVFYTILLTTPYNRIKLSHSVWMASLVAIAYIIPLIFTSWSNVDCWPPQLATTKYNNLIVM